MKFLKLLTALAAAAAAFAVCLAIIGRKKRKEEEMDELDAYLMGDDESPEVTTVVEASDEAMDKDFEEWDSLGEGVVVKVTFRANPHAVAQFQEAMAKTGCSSNYEGKTELLDILITGPRSREELDEIAGALDTVSRSTDSQYLGFAFEQ